MEEEKKEKGREGGIDRQYRWENVNVASLVQNTFEEESFSSGKQTMFCGHYLTNLVAFNKLRKMETFVIG